MQLASSDAAAVLFFLRKEKEKNGGAKRADSTRKGHAASVTLLRREQLRSASAPTNMSKVRQKIEEAGGQGRPPLRIFAFFQ